MDLARLKKPLPFKWKIQSFIKDKNKIPVKVTCVAYIDARDVMNILDEVCGAENWQTDYQFIKNSIYCSISIKINNEWIKKTDAGAPSETEADKGEASDALKRAAVQWGIGRFLYEKDIVFLDYDNAKKKALGDDGKPIYDLTKHINGNSKSQTKNSNQEPPAEPPKTTPPVEPPKPPAKSPEEDLAIKIIYKLKNNLNLDLDKSTLYLLTNEAKIPANLVKEATDLINEKRKQVVNIEPNKITDDQLANFDRNYVN